MNYAYSFSPTAIRISTSERRTAWHEEAPRRYYNEGYEAVDNQTVSTRQESVRTEGVVNEGVSEFCENVEAQ